MSSDSPLIKDRLDTARLRAMVLKCWQVSRLATPWSEPKAFSTSQAQAAAEHEGRPEGRPASVVELALHPLLQRFGELAVLSLVINLLSLAVPIFVLQVYDRVVFHGGLATLAGLVLGVMIALGFDFILRQARSRLMQMMALRVDISLIRALFDKLTNLPLRRLETQRDADWHGLLRDQECIRDTLAGPATILVVDLPFILLFIAVIWLVAEPIAWLLLALIPVYVIIAALSSWIIGSASRQEQEGFLGRQVLSAELVRGRIATKVLSLGSALQRHWETSQADLIKSSLNRGSKVDIFTNLSSVLAMTTTVVMTSIGALAIVHGELTIGGLIAANMLAARVVQPLVQMIGVWRTLARLREAVVRLNSLLEEPTDLQESTVARERPQGVITLENVDFRYEAESSPILRNISLTLRPGSIHGIVGVNGCGKTTLLNVLQGLYPPDRGRVLLDGADLRQFGREDLKRWIGYVPQDAALNAGTVKDNIARFADDVDDAAILLAAKQANADPFIVNLPDGYATEVGEGGQRFSVGQRQRIAFARALIGKPPILLLDEPNAHLDGGATQHLLSQIRRLSRECNVILITHSQLLLRACSNVLVLDRGTIAAAGPGGEIVDRLFGPRKTGAAA
ncbi:MAG: peptidase domain-containing ABC transporter [Geminicoccaceae bacterium]